MSDISKMDRRAVVGSAIVAGMLATGGSIKDAHAQILKTGISDDSVLAKMKKAGELVVGYAQTKPNFYLDVKTNKLRGAFYDATEFLGKEVEVKIIYKEVTWADSTVGLRKGDYDLFVSSMSYTAPRALVVSFVGPLYHKGFAAITHKDNKNRFRTLEDLNHKDVVFSVNTGNASAKIIQAKFPKAKIIEVSGPLAVEMEPVRSKRADAAVEGDLDMEVFVANNDWAYIVEPEHPFELLPNTWACRYGDPAWKAFLDMFCERLVSSGFMKDRFAVYRQELIKGG